jgi:predicted DNA-binding ribbon-helix-helix protein
MKRPTDGDAAAVRKRSVDIGGHRTSVSIEAPFWEALKSIADQRGISMNALIAEIDAARAGNLSSAIRVFVLRAAQETPGRAPARESSTRG